MLLISNLLFNSIIVTSCSVTSFSFSYTLTTETELLETLVSWILTKIGITGSSFLNILIMLESNVVESSIIESWITKKTK